MVNKKFINPPNQSKGILDDFAIRKNIATREGTIEKVPVNESDIANKKYVDENDHWDADGNDIYNTNAGSVGIGTNTPRAKLEVNGSSATITDKSFVVYDTADEKMMEMGDTWYSSGYYRVGDIDTAVNGTMFEIMDSCFYFRNGDVGIGTTSPNAKLEIDISGSGSVFQTDRTDAGGYFTIDHGGERTNFNSYQDYTFSRHGSEYMRIKNDGNVGIGTTTPKNKLDIEGAAVIGATYSGTKTAPTNGLLVEGKVGIGNDDPLYQLDVFGPTALGRFHRSNSDNVNRAPSFLMKRSRASGANINAGDWLGKFQFYGQVAGADMSYGGLGYISSDLNRAGRLFFYDGVGAEKISFLTTGEMGIGVSAPTASLNIKAGTATNPPLKFTSGTDLTNPEVGSVEYDGCRLKVTNVATQKAIDRTSDVAVSTVTVANTTTETTLWTGAMAANSLCAGNLFKFHADGIVSNGGPSATDQITFRVKVGGNTLVTLTPTTRAMGVGAHWHINANATQRTLGAAGSRAIHLELDIDSITSHAIAVANVDTTASMDVTLTAQWASAAADNTISLYQGFMEYKN